MTAEEELSNVFRETGFDIDNKIQQKLTNLLSSELKYLHFIQ